jgi:signal transduction histidine kinase
MTRKRAEISPQRDGEKGKDWENTPEPMPEPSLASLKHQLRTPLNHIIGYSEMLQEEAEDQGEESFIAGLQQIRAAGQQLLALINDNLDSLTIESGKASISRLRHQLRKPISQIISSSKTLQRRAESQGQLGPVHDLQKISAAARSLLAFSDDSATLSDIEANSLPSRLETFSKSAASPFPGNVALSREEPFSSGPKLGQSLLLVVEDNETSRDMLCRRLERQRHQVAAANGRQAIAMVRANSFDLILLDLMMPDMNGYQVLEQLKSDDSLRYIPVIMLSALEEVDSAVRCIEMGAEDYLSKPFNPILLKARIDACLEKKRLRDQEGLYLQSIESINIELEKRVEERVKELKKANEKLVIEMAERKRLEQQLLQSQKMESIGRLAGGIAHDFNNLLTPIMGYASLGAMSLPPEHPVHSHLEEVKKSAERASKLTHQLLAFSRGQIIEPKVINLNDLILNMDELIRRLIGEDIELVTIPTPDLNPVKVDPGQMEQVLMNLVVNARDAMPEGGKLTIATVNVRLDAKHTRQHTDVSAGRYATLSVTDTGIGITSEVKAHLFEPFFTTKEKGKGTGLGLATCYGIVKQNSGHIEVNSEPGRGTTFRIYLPRTEEKAKPEPGNLENGHIPRGTETVLLAEDEPVVRTMVATILQRQGYRVLQASNGDEALRLAQQHADEEIHLLMTDVVMPQMGGVELAGQFSIERPSAKLIFTSGYTEQPFIHQNTLAPSIEFIRKPFRPAALAYKIREVLDK